MLDEERKAGAAEFYDQAVSEQTRQELWSSYYTVARAAYAFYNRTIEERCEGARVLEYGCGTGRGAIRLLESGATRVEGIDISPVAIERARERARRCGQEGTSFHVMDAEQLDFPARSFDLVCGTSILQYLDLERAYAEASRVLEPTGTAVFLEPLGHNPLINLYRARTPELRTPDEHPLLISDIEAAHRSFGLVGSRFFTLAPLLAVPLRGTRMFDGLVAALDVADRAVFRLARFSRKYAWQVALDLRQPLR